MLFFIRGIKKSGASRGESVNHHITVLVKEFSYRSWCKKCGSTKIWMSRDVFRQGHCFIQSLKVHLMQTIDEERSKRLHDVIRICGKIKLAKMSTEEEFDRLSHTQRLKASVHYSSLKICQEHCKEEDIKLNKMVVATISEATWKKMEQFAFDLEQFTKHAKRTTVGADDVKMLIRKSPKLLAYINSVQDQISASKAETKKKTKKGKAKDSGAKGTSVPIDVDENSRN